MEMIHTKAGQSGGLSVFQLQKHRSLFVDDDAFECFVNLLQSFSARGSISIVLNDDQLISGLISPQDTQESLRSRIVSSLMHDPEALDEIEKRLGDENTVEYGKF